ncbi:MAG: phosphatidylserine decarboxylase [Sphingomonadales bacterium]
MEHITSVIPPIHPEGRPFILIFFVITLVLFLAFGNFLGCLGVILTLWCVYFFRDPKRVTPTTQGLIISPADGVVLPIKTVTPPSELGFGDTPLQKISIFMNVFDVHVNRAPIQGTVTKVVYIPGKFFNASLDKASEHNERQLLVMENADGMKIGFVQIAGLVARRIVGFVIEGDYLNAGERFGLIRFGSRVDIYLPEGLEPLVIEGQSTLAGETVLADIRFKEKFRVGNQD